ncbi:MAG: hypothetical protein WC741_04885 [Patescibacteria group bacterium]|jgi:hypothetical protein
MNAENKLRGRKYSNAVGKIFGQELSRKGRGIADLKLRSDYNSMETQILNRELGLIGSSIDEVKKKHLRAALKRVYSKLDSFLSESAKSTVRVVYPKINEPNMFLTNAVNGIGTFFAEQVGTMKQLGNNIAGGVTSFNIMDEFANIKSGVSRIVNVIKFIVNGEI